MPKTAEERKAAKRESNRRWRQANPDKHRAGQQRYDARHPEKVREIGRRAMARRRLERPGDYWHQSLRARARRRGLDYDLTPEFIEALLAPMVCSMTGLLLQPSPEGQEGRLGQTSPLAPSIDRVDSSRGYTQDNVQLTCWAYNWAKGNWSPEVFDLIARSYVEHQDG